MPPLRLVARLDIKTLNVVKGIHLEGLRKVGKPGELADAIAFLCSERASYITGVSLNLDGGRLKSLW